MDLSNTAHGGKVATFGFKVCITRQPIMHEPPKMKDLEGGKEEL